MDGSGRADGVSQAAACRARPPRRGGWRGDPGARPDDLRLAGRRREPGVRPAARPRPPGAGDAAAGTGRGGPGTDSGRDVWPMHEMRTRDRGGTARCPALGRPLHRVPERARSRRTLTGAAETAGVGVAPLVELAANRAAAE